MNNINNTICKEIFEKLIPWLKLALNWLKWYDERRKFLSQIAINIGYWWASLVSSTFKVGRDTLRKWIKEIKSWIKSPDNLASRWRKSSESKLPNLLKDIQNIIDYASQIDPKFKSTRLYTRLTQEEIRNQLIIQKWYKEEELPTARTIYNKAIDLWCKFSRVQKTKPKKK